MARKPRSNLDLSKRVDAVVAAMDIVHALVRKESERRSGGDLETSTNAWAIVHELRDAQVDRKLIRQWLDRILAACHADPYIRRDVGEIEDAVGLPHSGLTSGIPAGFGDAWDAYMRCRAEQPVTIEIPTAGCGVC